MLELARRARGLFVTLIEIRVHLIWVKLGHIGPRICDWILKSGLNSLCFYAVEVSELKMTVLILEILLSSC